jgi:hypothetical protein
VDEGENFHCLDGGVYVGAIPAGGLTATDTLGDDLRRIPLPAHQSVVQGRVGGNVLRQQHSECAHQFGCPVEAVGDLSDLPEQIAESVRMRVVVAVTRVQHRVQQLLLGFEVMQKARRGDSGFAGDLGERRVAPAVARQKPVRHHEDPLFAVLALGKKRLVRPYVGHRIPSSDRSANQPSEYTVGWFACRGKGRGRVASVQ